MKVLYFIFLLLPLFVSSQNNVGIGTVTPDSNALVDMTANDKGLLIPRLTYHERLGFTSSLGVNQKGMLVYDTDSARFYYWDSIQWVPLGQYGPQGIAGQSNIEYYGVNSSSSALICTTTFEQIPELNLSLTLTDSAKIQLVCSGGIHPNTSTVSFGPTIIISVFCNGLGLPHGTQKYAMENTAFSISFFDELPSGTYNFNVMASNSASSCIYVVQISNSQSSLQITVFY